MKSWIYSLISLLGFVVISATAATADIEQCTFISDNNKANYDLSTMRLGGETGFSFESGKVSYYFNICKNVKAPPACPKQSDDGVPLPEYAPAYAVDRTEATTKCYALGAADLKNKFKMTLLSEKRPSLGMSLQYLGGQVCEESTSGLDSTFKIRFHCAPEVEDAAPVVEINDCNFTIDISSPLACPMQCPLYSHKLCADKGLCDYDTDMKETHCFCNKGFYGPDCSKSTSDIVSLPACDGTCAALAVVFVLLIAIFGGVCYMAYNMWRVSKRGLRVNDDRRDLMNTMF